MQLAFSNKEQQKHNIQIYREVELATGLKDAIGLMFRKSTDKPMMFKYKDVKIRSFHTYFMRFDLDMFFIDERGVVIKVFRNLKPGNVVAAACQYMIETPSSWKMNFTKVGL